MIPIVSAHRHNARHRFIDGFDQNTHTKHGHDRAFDNSGYSLPCRATPEYIKAKSIHQRVAEHVQRIGEQRGRMRQQTGS